MDFFTVPTLTFRLLYVLFIIQHDRRKVPHVNVTANPTAMWVTQQIREAFPFATAPRYLLLDRDSIFSAEVVRALTHLGVEPVRTGFRSPWHNGVAERWVGTCRRELLDHVILLNEITFGGYYVSSLRTTTTTARTSRSARIRQRDVR